MKKIISIMLFQLFLTGCGSKQEDFYLNYNNKKLLLNHPFSENEYGKYNDSFESENCAFGDKDITYIYDDLEIEAYGNSKGEMIVYSIVLTSENVKTNEGIGLYDSLDDIISKYGDGYQKDGNTYRYVHNNTELVFVTQNNIIETIEYRLVNID